MKNRPLNIDSDLINRIKEGDTYAFRQMVETYKDVSLSLACSILKDKDKAEDVLQDVFIIVFRKIHTFNFKSAFGTWLYRIVVNMSYNELKRNRNHLDITTLEVQKLEDPKKIEFSILEEKDQEMYIQMALNQLRPDEALVLRLFYLCELKISEIEHISGFKKSKIKVDLHRGRHNLGIVLKQLLGSEIKNLL